MEEKIFEQQIKELAESRYALAIATMLNKLARKDVEIEALGKENVELRQMLNKYQG